MLSGVLVHESSFILIFLPSLSRSVQDNTCEVIITCLEAAGSDSCLAMKDAMSAFDNRRSRDCRHCCYFHEAALFIFTQLMSTHVNRKSLKPTDKTTLSQSSQSE